MNILPPLPSYESCHPIVVHFPIALLLVSPLFVVLALLWRKQAFAMNVAAAVLLSLGTAGAFLATSTGEAAEEAAEQTLAPKAVLEQHEELAELASKLFVGVSVLSIGVAGLSWWLRERPRAALAWGGGILLLAGQAGASVVLINAAHEGGRLVHEFGLRAQAPPAAALDGTPRPVEK